MFGPRTYFRYKHVHVHVHAALKKVGFELAAHAEGDRYTPHGEWPDPEEVEALLGQEEEPDATD